MDLTAEDFTKRLDLSEKHESSYRERVKKIIKTYRDDERKTGKAPPKMNLLWSNTETQRPSLFSAAPEPIARNRLRGPSINVAREASDVLERTIRFTLDNGLDDFSSFADTVITDFLLPGRSVDRVIYEPVNVEGEEGPETVFEQVRYHHVPWDQFRYDPQDRWEDVEWLAYGNHFFSREDLKEEFGLSEKELLGIPWKKNKDTDTEITQVWEMWDKEAKKVYWGCHNGQEILREDDPPVNLVGFFDCPRPAYAVKANDCLIPIPEYSLYQYQAEEVNDLTRRIDKITSAIRANFAYAGDEKSNITSLLTADDCKGVPVKDWTQWLERTGLDGLMSWVPVDQFAKVLQILTAERQQLVQQIFEITGIADIIRGSTDPRETAKAQSIKASFGSRRFLPKQQEIQRYFRDLMRISGEIIVEKFSRSTLQDICDVQISDEALMLLRDDAQRAFRIDIETDSTIQPDSMAKKQDMAEFVSSLAQFMQIGKEISGLGPAGQQAAVSMMGWFTDVFDAPRNVEDAIEQLATAPPPPPPPDPNMVKAQADAQAKQADLQIKAQSAQMDMQAKMAEMQLEAQKFKQEMEMKMMELQVKLKIMTDESQGKIMNQAMESQARRVAIERKSEQPARSQ